MQIQSKEVEHCKLEIHYEGDSEVVQNKVVEALGQLKKIATPGFRAGKAPESVLKMRFKKQIEEWVKREMSAQAYDDILFETKIKPIGYPQYSCVHLDGNNFHCDVTIMKKPDFELKEYKDLEVPRPHQPQTTADLVETMCQELRVRHGEIAPYEEKDFIQKGDQITVDFEATVDGKIIDGGKGEGKLLTVGESPLKEFDDNILGMAVGETREFDLMVDNGKGEQKTHMKLTLLMGSKRIPCPLDDELAKKVGFENYNAMRERLVAVAASKIQSIEFALMSDKVVNRLVADNDIKVPVWLVTMESQQLAMQEGKKWETVSVEDKEKYISRSTDNVKLALILDSVREKEPEAVLSDSELVGVIKERIAQGGYNAEQFIAESQKDGRLLGMMASLRNEHTLQWICSKCKITE